MLALKAEVSRLMCECKTGGQSGVKRRAEEGNEDEREAFISGKLIVIMVF